MRRDCVDDMALLLLARRSEDMCGCRIVVAQPLFPAQSRRPSVTCSPRLSPAGRYFGIQQWIGRGCRHYVASEVSRREASLSTVVIIPRPALCAAALGDTPSTYVQAAI